MQYCSLDFTYSSYSLTLKLSLFPLPPFRRSSHNASTYPKFGTKGWSEPATTNAPVEDEPVQPILRMNIISARRDFFFHLLSAPKFSTSPLLPPPSDLPPTNPTPPSLHRQNSRDLERLWSGSWSGWSWSWSGWSWSETHAPTKR